MGETAIEWTDVTWNPVRGCSRVSEGCRNCYAERVAARFSGPGHPYEGLARIVTKERVLRRDMQGGGVELRKVTDRGPRWTGEVRLVPERLADPLRWRKPKKIFVNSMSDLFHERLSNGEIAAVFGVMAVASKHTFQVLTKRPTRMLDWFAWAGSQSSEAGPRYHGAALTCGRRAFDMLEWDPRLNDEDGFRTWPLPNVWIGVSAENQDTAHERIPLLLQAPAAVRFVSYEPALGPVDLAAYLHRGQHLVCPKCLFATNRDTETACPNDGSVLGDDIAIDWVIAGCESGPNARPAQVDWFRSVRDQCKATEVPFFLKQASKHFVPAIDGYPMVDGWRPTKGPITAGSGSKSKGDIISLPYLDGVQHKEFPR